MRYGPLPILNLVTLPVIIAMSGLSACKAADNRSTDTEGVVLPGSTTTLTRYLFMSPAKSQFASTFSLEVAPEHSFAFVHHGDKNRVSRYEFTLNHFSVETYRKDAAIENIPWRLLQTQAGDALYSMDLMKALDDIDLGTSPENFAEPIPSSFHATISAMKSAFDRLPSRANRSNGIDVDKLFVQPLTTVLDTSVWQEESAYLESPSATAKIVFPGTGDRSIGDDPEAPLPDNDSSSPKGGGGGLDKKGGGGGLDKKGGER